MIRQLMQMVSEQEIYRIKGFVAVPGKAMRLVLNGVGNRFDYFYDRPWKKDELCQTKLIVIGHELDTAKIQAQFQ